LINNAVSELSLRCSPAEAGRGLYLISAQHSDMNMNLVKDIGTHLRRIAPEAIIRTGDYPREKGPLNVTVMLSELSGVSKIIDYFTKTIELIDLLKRKREGIEVEHRDLADSFRDIPSLL
ncbi:MAG: cell division protein FtsZ, partial [Dehalococcoidales bacterium]|nr:cell division protein FtsZ [Dehalococcoidales bacterium]